MRDEFEEPQPPALNGDAEAGVADAARLVPESSEATGANPLLPVPAGIRLLNRDFLTDAANLPDG